MWLRGLASIAITLLLGACGEPGTGPVEVKWDRATCERCRMVLSDRRHSAQVRLGEPKGGSRVYPFDDLGCALIWLEGRPGRIEAANEIWVSDWRTGDWIDARTASFVPNQITPMQYGLGAQPDPAPGTLDFAQARDQVLEAERRNQAHTNRETPLDPSPGIGPSAPRGAAPGRSP